MQLDRLNSTDFWNLTYKTAKNRKSQKKTWAVLMSPEHADTVRNMAQTHVTRIQKEINRLTKSEGYAKNDPQIVKMVKARDFISGIGNSAKHAIEKDIAAGRNVRKYAKIQDLIGYTEYLKDCIEDLRQDVPADELYFPLHVTFESWETDDDDNQSLLDDWIEARKARREAR